MSEFIKTSAEFVEGFQPPDYLVDGVLQKQFCYSVTAKTGVGKTAVAMLLAALVSTGRRLGQLEVVKGAVLYLAGENPSDIQMRWLGLTRELQIDPASADVHFIAGVIPLSQVAVEITAEVVRKRLEPALVIVDTAAAFFEGVDDNSNVEMGDYARVLRSLTQLPGGPCVLILAHPTKRAADDDLIPRGGSAFLNEVDGNIALQKRDTLLVASAQGKFRGPEFSPISFALKVVNHPAFKDTRGRQIPTVIAQALDDAGRTALDASSQRDEDKLLRMIETRPRASLREVSILLGWGHHSRAERLLKTLVAQKLVRREGRAWCLTSAGQRELNAQDSKGHLLTVAPSVAPLVPPMPLPPPPR